MRQKKFTLNKGIILIIAIIVITLITIFSYYLYNIQKNHEIVFDESSKMIIKETDMVKITNMYVSQEESLYHIFTGETKTEEEVISSIRLRKDKDLSPKNIKTHKSTDMVSEKAILNKWLDTCNQCEKVKIQPAIIDKELLWEITYTDGDDRYVFAYYLMKNGTKYEEVKLKRNFN